MKKIYNKETMSEKLENSFWEIEEAIEKFELRLKKEFIYEEFEIKYSTLVFANKVYLFIGATRSNQIKPVMMKDIYSFGRPDMAELDLFLGTLDFITEDVVSFKSLSSETSFDSVVNKINNIVNEFKLERFTIYLETYLNSQEIGGITC